MKNIIIQVESIMKYPPTMSLIKILKELGHELVLLSSEINEDVRVFCDQNDVELCDLGHLYSAKDPAYVKMLKIPLIKQNIDRYLNDGTEDDIIWVMTSITLKYIGNSLYDRKYIMYMYELSQEIRYYQKIPFLKINLEKLYQNASAIIHCEYNRAHIAQAWFGLKCTPYIIPNKPYMDKLERNINILDSIAREKIEKIKDKKIIMYQGIIDDERPIEPFVNAINNMNDDYVLVVMSGDVDKIKKYENERIILLPFVKPPHHLEITSWAYIGILTYVPVRNATTSPLNALYCAPNKIYEYSMFGIPMLGNNIPGLKSIFENNKMGETFEHFSQSDIKDAIYKISNNFDLYQKKSSEFYNEVDTKMLIEEIMNAVSNTGKD